MTAGRSGSDRGAAPVPGGTERSSGGRDVPGRPRVPRARFHRTRGQHRDTGRTLPRWGLGRGGASDDAAPRTGAPGASAGTATPYGTKAPGHAGTPNRAGTRKGPQLPAVTGPDAGRTGGSGPAPETGRPALLPTALPSAAVPGLLPPVPAVRVDTLRRFALPPVDRRAPVAALPPAGLRALPAALPTAVPTALPAVPRPAPAALLPAPADAPPEPPTTAEPSPVRPVGAQPTGATTTAEGAAAPTVETVPETAAPRLWPPVAARGIGAGYGRSGAHWAAPHTGIDLPVATGTAVHAVTDGTLSTGWTPAHGYLAIVRAADGTETWYAHLSGYRVRSGRVRAGDVIAASGATGNATGPHLHFEVRPGGGAPVDPLPWLLAHGLDPR